MKRKLLTLIALPALIAIGQAQAQTLNFAISGDNASGGDVDFAGLAAAPDSPSNTFWNQINLGTYQYNDGANEFTGGGVTGGGFPQQNTPTFGGNPYYNENSDGSTSYVTLSTTNNISIYQGSQGAQGTPQAFFNPFLRDTSGPITFTLNNVATGSYDLYLYATNGGYGGQSTTFTVTSGGTTSSLTANYSTDSTTSAYVEGVNYVEFQDLSVGANGTITFSLGASPGFSEGDFDGLQLQAVGAVPEPSTWALMLAGAIGLFVYQKRASRVG